MLYCVLALYVCVTRFTFTLDIWPNIVSESNLFHLQTGIAWRFQFQINLK